MPNLILTYRDLQSLYSSRDLQLLCEKVDLQSLLSSSDLSALALLDPNTKNRYFRSGHETTMTDLYASAFSKFADTDAFSFSDFSTTNFVKGSSDSFSFQDSHLISITFFREFADSFALDDFSAVDAVVKDMANAKTNVFGFADDQAFGVAKGLTDTFGITDGLYSYGISKGLTDIQPMTESLARSVQYSRVFIDTFVMDDAATVDAIEKATSSLKQNIVSIGDTFGRTVVFKRQFTDSVSPTEDHSVSLSKPAADSFSVSEVLSRAVTYNRSFSELQSLVDTVGSIGLAKGLSDSQPLSESHFAETSLGKTDSVGLIDSPSQVFNKPTADSIVVSESLARAVAYTRTFTDAFSLDDAATVNALVKDHANTKTNVFSFAEDHFFGFSKAATDTFSLVEAESFELSRGISDSVSMTENLSHILYSHAVMNTAPLNASPLNE